MDNSNNIINGNVGDVANAAGENSTYLCCEIPNAFERGATLFSN